MTNCRAIMVVADGWKVGEDDEALASNEDEGLFH